MLCKRLFIAVLMLTGCVERARAGASLFVDDAAITPPGQCQVESWARTFFPAQEFTVVPACHFAGSEFSLGVAQATSPVSMRTWMPGIKHVLRDFGPHRWGLGISLGASWDARRGRWVGGTLNLPASIALDDDLVLHANLGWNKVEGRAGVVTGGVGSELALGASWTLLAEVYGDPHGTAAGQVGLRRAIGGVASLDLLIGHEAGLGTGPWFTLGLNIAFAR